MKFELVDDKILEVWLGNGLSNGIGLFSFAWIGDQILVTREKLFLPLKKMAPQKLELDLIDQFQKAMILEAFVKKIMVSFVLVIP